MCDHENVRLKYSRDYELQYDTKKGTSYRNRHDSRKYKINKMLDKILSLIFTPLFIFLSSLERRLKIIFAHSYVKRDTRGYMGIYSLLYSLDLPRERGNARFPVPRK